MSEQNTFTATNSTKIYELGNGGIVVVHPEWYQYRLYPDHVEAITEYVQDRRDKELGRWRYDETCVIYPAGKGERGRQIRVLDETTGVFVYVYERSVRDESGELADPNSIRGGMTLTYAAAVAYFKAHPPTEPWQDAEPSEIWVFKPSEGSPLPFKKTRNGRWENQGGVELPGDPWPGSRDKNFTPYRIWPESEVK